LAADNFVVIAPARPARHRGETSEDNVIEIRDLHKYYGNRRALGPLDFSIETGQIVGLLGLNGAGKTTTLRILACDLLPTDGTVSVGGIDVVSDPDAVKAKIGYLPDSPPLYPEMTVREYVRFTGRIRGVANSKIAQRVEEVLRLTELASVADDLISTLSHGYKQRVGIAQAIVHKPELVILDEPISGLDPVQIVEMRELIRSLKGSHTVVISSHILSEISETCDRILVMGDGKIIADGTEKELSERWLSGMRVEVLVRCPPETDVPSFLTSIRDIPGVTEVTPRDTREPGENLVAFDVHMKGDRRELLVATLVSQEFGILQISRSHRDLETVFLQLSDSSASTPTHRVGATAGVRERSAQQEEAQP
jgi:ABC-2 type transport system ATP-binding protein